MKVVSLLLIVCVVALGVADALNRVWRVGFLYSSSKSFPNHRLEFDVALEDASPLLNKWNDKIVVIGTNPPQTPAFQIVEQSLFLAGANKKADAVDIVLGPETTQTSVDSNTVFRLFNIPQIGFGSADELSQKSLYPTYNRVVSKSSPQGLIYPFLLKHFGWKKATAIATSDAFGQGLLNNLLDVSKLLGISITSFSFPSNFNDSTGAFYDSLMREVRDTGNHVIISITSRTDNELLATAAKKLGMWGSPYIWIGNSANIPYLPTGSLGTQFLVDKTTAEWNYFRNYFNSSPLPPQSNITFEETKTYQGYFWDAVHLTVGTFDYLNKVRAACAPYIVRSDPSDPHSASRFTYTGSNTITVEDGSKAFPPSWCSYSDSKLLLACMRNLSFRGATSLISLDQNGDQPPKHFTIVQKTDVGLSSIGHATILDKLYEGSETVNDVSMSFTSSLLRGHRL